MSKFRVVMFALAMMVIIGVMSCRSLLEEVVPVTINKRAAEYAGMDKEDFGVIESLADARRVAIEIAMNHRDAQLQLKRLAEDDLINHGDAHGFISQNIAAGEQTLDLMIGSEDNPFSIMGILAYLGMGAGGLAVGRKYMKRPGDFSPEEHYADISRVKNGHS